MTRLTDVARLNAGTPMFCMRVNVSAAELVCSVDRTRWPVWAALTAISAVSRSRTSPTMTTSGSWRRNDRSAVAKSRPTRVLTWTWLMPSMCSSTGSSAVAMLRVLSFRRFSPA